MRLASIDCAASDLGACVRSLPRPCKSAHAASNASQIVRVLLKSNASGFSTIPQTLRPTCFSARAEGRSKGSCDEVDCRPGRFATAARSLGGYAGHSRKYSYSFVTIRRLLSRARHNADENACRQSRPGRVDKDRLARCGLAPKAIPLRCDCFAPVCRDFIIGWDLLHAEWIGLCAACAL